MLPPKDANRGGGFQETMKLSTYYTTIEHQTEWNQSKEEIEEKKPLQNQSNIGCNKPWEKYEPPTVHSQKRCTTC